MTRQPISPASAALKSSSTTSNAASSTIWPQTAPTPEARTRGTVAFSLTQSRRRRALGDIPPAGIRRLGTAGSAEAPVGPDRLCICNRSVREASAGTLHPAIPASPWTKDDGTLASRRQSDQHVPLSLTSALRTRR
jgi:hypothetical protein